MPTIPDNETEPTLASVDVSEQKAFYDGLAMGNAVSYQQAQNNIMLSVTSKLTQVIMEGEDTVRAKELMAIMKELHSNE